MSPNNNDKNTSTRARFAPWALVPIALLGGSVTLVVAMVMVSTNDPGFAVEPDYYQKAVDWDRQRAQELTNRELGWRATWSFAAAAAAGTTTTVAIELMDAAGLRLNGAVLQVHAFHNARASRVQQLSLREVSPGRYEAPLELHRGGLWECRLRVTHHGQVFTQVHQAELTLPVLSAKSVAR
jgi:hypothetical protein